LLNVVLTVPRASPVACATSLAVIAPSAESAPSTFALVAPGAVRAREATVRGAEARFRGAADDGEGVLAGNAERSAGFGVRLGVDFSVGLGRGSSAASA
jgi:hypothetical protein